MSLIRFLRSAIVPLDLGEDQELRERELIKELLSLKEVFHNAKQCPSCKISISRTEGCNKMVCSNCGQKFCYRCNEEISGYEHFRSALMTFKVIKIPHFCLNI